MKELKLKCIEMIKRHHSDVIKTDEDAAKVFDFLVNAVKEKEILELGYKINSFGTGEIVEEDILYFIEEKLVLFSTKKEILLEWFYDIDCKLCIGDFLENNIIKITDEMIGKDLEEVVYDSILNKEERYAQISDNIFLSYYC